VITDQEQRILPAAVEAEKAVLGAILLDEKAYDQAADLGLAPADFFLDSHRRIYAAVSDLREAGQPVDPVTLRNELETRKQLEAVGGAAYVAGLLDGVPDRPSIKAYVKLVQDASQRRNLIHACTASIAQASEGSSKAPECLSNLGDTLLQIQGGLHDAPAERIAAFTDAAIAEWNQRAYSPVLPGLTTGIDKLDKSTTGIRKGELWSIGGRQGDGKSALALQIAAANIEHEIPVGIFGLEMTREEILERLWAHEAGVFSQIRDPGHMTRAVHQQILDAARKVGCRPLFICEDGSLSIQKLVAKARILIRREKVRLLIVDYVQLVAAPASNERERIGKVSNGLRALAKDTAVPVLALSQLTKPDKYNPNHRPNRFNFRESSAIADDSHVCLLVYRPVHEEGHAQAGQYTGKDQIIIDKQRHGPRDFVRVKFLEEKQLFDVRF